MRKTISMGLLILLFLVAFTACGSGGGGDKLDASALCEVKVVGLDGFATATVSPNQTIINGICDDISTEQGFTEAAKAALFFDTLQYKIVSDKTDNLSNGDTIKVELSSYSQDAAKEMNISFSNTTFTHTVEGLGEGEAVDPFEGLEIEYEGISPFATVSFNKLATNDFVRDHVTFSAEPRKDLSNGDTITVTVQYDANQATQKNIMLTEESRNYTVEGLPEYVVSLQGADFSQLIDPLNTVMKDRIDSNNGGRGNWPFLSTNGDHEAKWNFENDMTIVEAYYLVNKDNISNNAIVVVYRVDTKGICYEIPSRSSFSSASVGEERESTSYFVASIKNISVLDNIASSEGKAELQSTTDTNLEKMSSHAQTLIKSSQVEEINLN